MNATCAGGAGGFIDTIAFMLDVDPADMSALAFKARTIHPIASRCAVFAQTDVRPLLNAGTSKADIAASAYDAVTRQTIGACVRAPRQRHGIDEELVRQGFSVLCMAGLAGRLREARKVQYAGTYPWKPAKRLVRATAFVTSRPNVGMICLQSFGCGFDAMSIEEARGVLEEARRPCTALKIDDVSDIAHIRIRLRTLAEAIETGARKRKAPGLAAPSRA